MISGRVNLPWEGVDTREIALARTQRLHRTLGFGGVTRARTPRQWGGTIPPHLRPSKDGVLPNEVGKDEEGTLP